MAFHGERDDRQRLPERLHGDDRTSDLMRLRQALVEPSISTRLRPPWADRSAIYLHMAERSACLRRTQGDRTTTTSRPSSCVRPYEPKAGHPESVASRPPQVSRGSTNDAHVGRSAVDRRGGRCIRRSRPTQPSPTLWHLEHLRIARHSRRALASAPLEAPGGERSFRRARRPSGSSP